MRKRPILPATTPRTRPIRVGVPRHAIRVSLQPLGEEERVRGWVQVISMTGMFVSTHGQLPDDQEVHIEWMARLGDKAVHMKLEGRVVIPDEEYQQRAFRMKTGGWVVRSHKEGIAVQFDPQSVREHPELEEMIRAYIPEEG